MVEWLGDGLINISRVESNVHTLVFSFNTNMTVSHIPCQAFSVVNSRQYRDLKQAIFRKKIENSSSCALRVRARFCL